eukprot:gene145-6864_t
MGTFTLFLESWQHQLAEQSQAWQQRAKDSTHNPYDDLRNINARINVDKFTKGAGARRGAMGRSRKGHWDAYGRWHAASSGHHGPKRETQQERKKRIAERLAADAAPAAAAADAAGAAAAAGAL